MSANFLDFCKKIATPGKIQKCENESVPEKYSGPVSVLISNMVNKRESFDHISISPYIEEAFNQDYEAILDEKLPDGEFPGSILAKLSKGIYFIDDTSELNEDQAAIIKTLAAYICIQN